MDREKTVSGMPFEEAADKKWYLSMSPASPKQTLDVQFCDGVSYKYLGTGKVSIGDPVIIDYGGASSYQMGNVIAIDQGVTIKRSHALKPLFTFTTDPGKNEIKRNAAAVKEMAEVKDVSSYFSDFYLCDNNGVFHVVDCLVDEVLNAISVVAFPELAGVNAVNKAKLFLAEEKHIPSFVFGKEFTDTYFGASADVPYSAETAETSLTGFYPGWKEAVVKCDAWESEELAKVNREWDEREQAYYLYYKKGTNKLKKFFAGNESFKRVINELVFRSALSIIIRGGLKNLLEAALSVQMPIKGFYDKLIGFAKEIGSDECYEVLRNTDYKKKSFEKMIIPEKAAKKGPSKDFVIDAGTLKKYKGKEEVILIPDGVKVIDKNVFYENSSLKKVVLPDTVTQIKDSAFAFCNHLEAVVFSTKMTTLAPGAFTDDKSLKAIDLSHTKVKTMRKKCFYCCKNLEVVQLPDCLKSIEDFAFANTAMSECYLPASIEIISPSAFNRKIADLYFAGTEAVDFNIRAFTHDRDEALRIHCKKDSSLWNMFRDQIDEIEEESKAQTISFRPAPILPELIEL